MTLQELKELLDKYIAEHGGDLKIVTPLPLNPDYDEFPEAGNIERKDVHLGWIHKERYLLDRPKDPFQDKIVFVIE